MAKTVTCPDCKGRGRIYDPITRKEVACYRCGGSGVIQV